MILNQEKNKCLTNTIGRTESTAFTIQANAKMFKILSSSLYSNKEKAIIREISCNAYDANIEACNGNKPIEIHLPNTLEPYFSVKDNGTGLTPEQMTKIYIQYGNSTKTDNNDAIGCLGLGSKSPFAYTSMFNVISISDGLKLIPSNIEIIGISSSFIKTKAFKEIKDTINQINYESIIVKSYPLFSFLYKGFSSEYILDYIKGQDLLKKYNTKSSANNTKLKQIKEA